MNCTRVVALLEHPRTTRTIIAVGFAIRLLAFAFLAPVPLKGDAFSYHEVGQFLAHGTSYAPAWPPGLPLYLSVPYHLSDAQVVGRALMLVVYGVFCALVLAVGRRVGGLRAANTALAFFAVTPIFVWASVNPITQLYSATLALGVVLFAARTIAAPRLRDAAILGLCLAWLLMTRPSNSGIAVMVPLYVLWRTRRWQTLVVPAAIIALTVGAWSMKAHAMTGRAVFINDANSQNIFYGNNPWTPMYRTWWFGSRHAEDGDEVPADYAAAAHQITALPLEKRDAAFVHVAVEHIKDRPDLFAIRTFSRVRTFAAFETYTSAQVAPWSKLLGGVTLALDATLYIVLIGLAILFPAARVADHDGETPDRKETTRLIVGVSILYALPYFIVFSHPTFHFTDVPLIGVLGAMAGVTLLDRGLDALWRALSRRGRIAVVLGGIAFAFIQIEWAIDVLSRPRRGT